MFAKVLVAAAVYGLAAAESTSSICSQATATINSAADATALAESCTTVSGAVEIGSDVAGALAFDGIDQITGDFTAYNVTQITSISSTTLNSIGGTFKLSTDQILSTLSFGQLTSVGAIHWEALPALESLSFSEDLAQADSLLITNTGLTTLNGINLQTTGDFDVNNNPYLTEVSTQLANSTGVVRFQANGRNFTVEFPNLVWAANLSITNVSSLTINSLATVNGTAYFGSNYFESIMAPNLTSTGSDLSFVANSGLTNISMPALKTSGGGFVIANNTDLMTIDGFAKLATVDGAFDVTGNFTEAEFPSLTNVKGAFNMVSSGNFSCDPFKEDNSNGVIKGKYTCSAGSSNVQTGTGTSTSSGSSSSSTSTSAAAPATKASMPMMVGSALIFGGLLQMSL